MNIEHEQMQELLEKEGVGMYAETKTNCSGTEFAFFGNSILRLSTQPQAASFDITKHHRWSNDELPSLYGR